MTSQNISLERSSRLLENAYKSNTSDFVFGYSGGKDSSAVLKVLFYAMERDRLSWQPTTVVYCDTGVEIPVVRALAYQTLVGIHQEASQYGYDLKVKIAVPEIKNRFFVKIIGRGYPTPTNKFRWCTDKLRIDPIQSVLKQTVSTGEQIVVLGVRQGESLERDRTLSKHSLSEAGFFNHAGASCSRIFSPIYDYKTRDVWELLGSYALPRSIDYERLLRIYKDAESECPIIRDSKAEPCAGSRFGCWTCTVVRKDKAMTNLISNSYSQLSPLLEFRNFMSQFRDNLEYREKRRRNGTPGLGPITLSGRRILLKKLLETQKQYGSQLISEEEIAAIKDLWTKDSEQVDAVNDEAAPHRD